MKLWIDDWWYFVLTGKHEFIKLGWDRIKNETDRATWTDWRADGCLYSKEIVTQKWLHHFLAHPGIKLDLLLIQVKVNVQNDFYEQLMASDKPTYADSPMVLYSQALVQLKRIILIEFQ